MKNWTDKIINWNQLPGTEVRRLIATWGMTPEAIARYDRKHGFASSAVKPHVSNTANPVDFPKTEKKAPAKAVSKKVESKKNDEGKVTVKKVTAKKAIEKKDS